MAEGVQAGGSAAPGDAEFKPSLVTEVDTRGGPRPWGVAGQGSGMLGADRELFVAGYWACDVLPIGDLPVTCVLAVLCSKREATGFAGSLGPAGLPTWMGTVEAGGSEVIRAKPFAVVLPTTGRWATGWAFGAASLSPFISWVFCRTLGAPASTGVAAGCLEVRAGNAVFAEVALE